MRQRPPRPGIQGGETFVSFDSFISFVSFIRPVSDFFNGLPGHGIAVLESSYPLRNPESMRCQMDCGRGSQGARNSPSNCGITGSGKRPPALFHDLAPLGRIGRPPLHSYGRPMTSCPSGDLASRCEDAVVSKKKESHDAP